MYFVIVLLGYYVSDIKKYLDNLKNISYLKNDYEKIRHSTVSLIFNIKCYHHEKRGSKGKS